MKKLIFVLAILLLGVMVYADMTYVPDDMKDEIMPVDKVERGMEGYGLTVFQGVTIEKFNFKVLGVIKGFNSGHDVIYVELFHPRINKSDSAVIQGMSGSPCYINGKLVGAVALGYSFAKENVCMLTPIEDMFETWDPNVDRDIEASEIGAKSLNDMAMPISVSGLSAQTKELMAGFMKERGFVLEAGFGGSSYGSKENMPDADKATLEPGAAVGVTLVDGDIVAAGTGTVTYKKGDRILAFGHPMDRLGVTELPMSKAYIVDIFSSVEISRKISNPLEIVGTVNLDRSFAISGIIGKECKMSPVNVHVKDLTTKKEIDYHCRVPSKMNYFNAFAPMVIVESVNRCRICEAPTYGEFTYKIKLVDGSEFVFSNCYTSDKTILDQVLEQVTNTLEKLNSSKYGVQKVASIDVEGKICDGNRYAFIERVFLNKNTFKPGDDVTIGVEMRNYGAKDTYTDFRTIKIPEDAEPGKFAILVYGGILSDSIKLASKETSNNKVLALFADKDNTTKFETYFKKYLETEKNNELVISLVQEKGSTLVAEGEKLSGLPDYMKMLFSNTNNSVITSEPVEYKSVFKTNIIPMGLATIALPVEQEIKATTLDNTAKPLINIMNPYEIKNMNVASFNRDIETINGKIYKFIDELDEAINVTSQNVKDQNIPSLLTAETKENKTEAKEEKTEKKENKDVKKAPAKIKSSIKKPLVLEYKEPKDFNQGIYKNCNIGNKGILPTVEFLKTIDLPQQLVTCGAETSLGTFIGTGLKSGIGLLIDDKVNNIVSLEGLWTSSICEVKGNVFVSANPGAMIYKVSLGGDGNPVCEKLSFDSHHKYISSMTDFGDNILVGFSDSGEIMLLDTNLKLLKKITHKGVFTAKFAKWNDKIYCGTKNKIIALDKNLNEETIIDNLGGTVTSLSVNSKGNIYAFISGKNIIVKIDETGIKKIVPKAAESFVSYCDNTDTVFFIGRDTITKIYSDDNYVLDKYTDTAAQFSDFVKCGENIYMTSTNPGKIFKVSLHPKECVYTSPTIDLGAVATLKSIDVPVNYCEVLVGDTLETAKPSVSVNNIKNFKIFVKFNEAIQGTFNKISLKYFMPNRAPEVNIITLATNDIIKGTKKIDFVVNDLDKDAYELKLYAKALGEDYKEISVFKNEPDKEPVKTVDFDTKTLPDGLYDFKLVADDTPSNPENGKIGECEIKSVTIKNNAPTITLDVTDIKIKEGEKTEISGVAQGKNFVGVEYSVGTVYRQVLLFEGGKFRFTLNDLKKGEHKIKVRAVDEEDNYTEGEVKVTVE